MRQRCRKKGTSTRPGLSTGGGEFDGLTVGHGGTGAALEGHGGGGDGKWMVEWNPRAPGRLWVLL